MGRLLWARPGWAPRLEDVSSWPPLTICSVQKAGTTGEGSGRMGGDMLIRSGAKRGGRHRGGVEGVEGGGPGRLGVQEGLQLCRGLGSGDLGGGGS